MKKRNLPAPFSRRGAGQVGAWLLAKPLSSVRSRQHRRRFPGVGLTKLAPGSSQSLCLPSGHANIGAVFSARGRPSWRLAPRKAFVFRHVTPTPAPFSRRGADQVGAWLLAKPLSSVGSRQHRRRFSGASPAKLAPGSSQSLCLPSGHANTSAAYSARGRSCWRLTPREAIFHRRATPTPAPFSRRGADQVGALAPEDVVLVDEGIRVCGERRTTSDPLPSPCPRKTWCSTTKE